MHLAEFPLAVLSYVFVVVAARDQTRDAVENRLRFEIREPMSRVAMHMDRMVMHELLDVTDAQGTLGRFRRRHVHRAEKLDKLLAAPGFAKRAEIKVGVRREQIRYLREFSLVDTLVVAVAQVAKSLAIGKFQHLGLEFLEARFHVGRHNQSSSVTVLAAAAFRRQRPKPVIRTSGYETSGALRGVGLALWLRLLERRMFIALLIDSPNRRELREVDSGALRVVHLRHQESVRNRRRIAMTEAARLLRVREQRLDRLEAHRGEMADPIRALLLARLQRAGEIVLPFPDDGMDLARDCECEGAHTRAAGRIARQNRRIRMRLVEVFADRQRLSNQPAVVVERRDDFLRIDRPVRGLMLLAFAKIDRRIIVAQSLERHRDPHAITRRRAEEVVKLHRLTSLVS